MVPIGVSHPCGIIHHVEGPHKLLQTHCIWLVLPDQLREMGEGGGVDLQHTPVATGSVRNKSSSSS